MYNFEKLEVWQKTRKFVSRIYEVTGRYPSSERFGLVQHTRESAVSILSNIAEGGSRFSKTESKRFIEIALGSLYETVTRLFVALDNGYLRKNVFENVYNDSEIIVRMLSGLSSSFKNQQTINHKL